MRFCILSSFAQPLQCKMNAIVQDSLGGRPVQAGDLVLGDLVRIIRGPFAGLFGSAVAFSGSRAKIVVTIHGRKLALEIEADWVDASPPRRRSVSSVEEPRVQHRSGS